MHFCITHKDKEFLVLLISSLKIAPNSLVLLFGMSKGLFVMGNFQDKEEG